MADEVKDKTDAQWIATESEQWRKTVTRMLKVVKLLGDWRTDKPKRVGWFPASTGKRTYVWRWWDGKAWSEPAYADNRREQAVRSAKVRRGPGGSPVFWLDWEKRA